MLERPCSDATGEDDHPRCGHLLEHGVRAEAEHPVLGAHLALVVTQENDVEVRHALEDLVGTDGVERGDPREEGDGDLEAARGVCAGGLHAGVASRGLVRKRRR